MCLSGRQEMLTASLSSGSPTESLPVSELLFEVGTGDGMQDFSSLESCLKWGHGFCENNYHLKVASSTGHGGLEQQTGKWLLGQPSELWA